MTGYMPTAPTQEIAPLNRSPPPDHLLLLRWCSPDSRIATQEIHRWLPLLKKSRRLSQKAVEQGLGGMLCRNLLKANALTQLPPSVQKQLRTVYRTTAAANVRIRPILEKSLKALNREEVPCVLLKGAALNLEVYDDPGLRGMSDIDIWIPEYHAPHGEKILVDLGYRPDPLYPTTYRNGTVTIDVHSHFLGADRIRSRKRTFGATAGEVLRRSVPVTVDKSRALSLDPLDQVLFLWLHALKHNLGKLAWLADIHCITAPWGASDWHGFQERCRMLGHTISEISLRWFLEYLEGKRSRVTEQRFSRLGILRRYVFRQFIECGAMPQ